eukprot:3931691-Rhodomonas_salina.3
MVGVLGIEHTVDTGSVRNHSATWELLVRSWHGHDPVRGDSGRSRHGLEGSRPGTVIKLLYWGPRGYMPTYP